MYSSSYSLSADGATFNIDNTDIYFRRITCNLENPGYRDCLRFREKLFCQTDKDILFEYVKRAFKAFNRYLEDTYPGNNLNNVQIKQICGSLSKFQGLKYYKFDHWGEVNGWWILARYFGKDLPKDVNLIDPSGLLNIIWNCNLFDPEVQNSARRVIDARNRLYAHIPDLMFPDDYLKACKEPSFKFTFQAFEDLYSKLSNKRNIYPPPKPIPICIDGLQQP